MGREGLKIIARRRKNLSAEDLRSEERSGGVITYLRRK